MRITDPSNRLTRSKRSDCAEYEWKILDAVVDGADAETLAHLETCDDCAMLASQYVAVAGIARASLIREPARRSWFRSPIVTLVAALLLVSATTFLARRSNDASGLAEAHRLTVLPKDGAIVEQIDPLHAAIREGESTFVFADSRPSVETPFGQLHCSGGCEFTVSIEPDACASLVGLKMTLHVTAGEVASLSNGRSDILTTAHSFTLPYDHYR